MSEKAKRPRSAAAAATTHVNLTVNAQPYRLEIGKGVGKVEPSRNALFYAQGTLGLTGTKLSCDGGACGGCTVIMDGKAVLSCTVLAIECDGTQVTTIEGLRGSQNGRPRSSATVVYRSYRLSVRLLHAQHMIMSAKALLNENPSPTENEVKEALSGNFCRCISHYQVVDAVMAASKRGP